MFDKFVYDLLMVWVTIEPIGTAVLFATLTARLARAEQRRVAVKATMYSAVILLASIVGGQLLLSALDIQLISLQVAGGIILFLFAIQMIFGQMEALAGQPEAGHDIAVFPLAVPSIVGAETVMVVVLLSDYHIHTFPEQLVTVAVVLLVLLVTLVLMFLAAPIFRVIGKNGAAILERITGIILAALAVELVMEALGVARWIGQ